MQSERPERERDEEHPRGDREGEEVPVAELLEVGVGRGDDALRVGKLQRESAHREQRREGHDEWLQAHLRDQHAVHDADGGARCDPYREAEEQAMAALPRGQHAPERDDRADREVDAAGHDDEGHAECDEPVLGVVPEQVAQVRAPREVVPVARRPEGDEREQGDQRALALDAHTELEARRGLPQPVPAGGVTTHGAGLRGRR